MSKNIKPGAIILHKGIPMYIFAIEGQKGSQECRNGHKVGNIVRIKSGNKYIYMTPLTQFGSLGTSALKT
jgi:hypothetical protein